MPICKQPVEVIEQLVKEIFDLEYYIGGTSVGIKWVAIPLVAYRPGSKDYSRVVEINKALAPIFLNEPGDIFKALSDRLADLELTYGDGPRELAVNGRIVICDSIGKVKLSDIGWADGKPGFRDLNLVPQHIKNAYHIFDSGKGFHFYPKSASLHWSPPPDEYLDFGWLKAAADGSRYLRVSNNTKDEIVLAGTRTTTKKTIPHHDD